MPGLIELPESLIQMMAARDPRRAVFVRLEAKGIDKSAAIEHAAAVVEEHLTILNALCSDGFPSRVRLTSGSEGYHAHHVYRTWTEVNNEATANRGLRRNLTRVPLSKADYENRFQKHGGQRISDWLKNPTEIGKRLLSGYVLAGTACTDRLPRRSFLLFAIALESVVMGKSNKTEIGFQLSTDVANLIGDGLAGKRLVKKEVNALYGIRSGIAHAGKNDVTKVQVEQMRQLCLRTLLALTISPAFATINTSKELDEWFTDRLLDSPNHLLE